MNQKCKIFFLLFSIAIFTASKASTIPRKTALEKSTLSSSKPTVKQVFYFGKHAKKSKEATIVNKSIPFDSALGYGFDFNTAAHVKWNSNSFTTEAPTYFSVQLPEGNYQVSVNFGSKTKNTNTTIKAESRRLMLDLQELKKGEIATKTFNVNVRTIRIDENSEIKLKKRDIGQLNWDEKLTLEFLGTVEIKSISITPIPNVTSVYLAGDSTVTDQDVEPWASWGQYITNYFNDKIVVSNYAASGLTLRSFKADLRLKKILSIIKPGDYLIVEFAHNDEKERGEGIGPWDSYSTSLREYVQAARDKGAIPILITPVQRRVFNADGTLKPTHGDYPDAMRKLAQEMKVPLVDLTKLTTTLYESWGDEPSRKAFVQYPANTFPGQKEKLEDNTHFNSFGANEIALCVMQGLRDLKNPLAHYFIKPVPQYNPKHPNTFAKWTLPMSTRFETAKPDGN
ncbi:MAG: rhamnogalacturonan acetylesterase [Flavobacterium sp.]